MRSVFSTPISHLCVIKPSIGEPKVGDQHETRTYDQDQKPLHKKIEKIQSKLGGQRNFSLNINHSGSRWSQQYLYHSSVILTHEFGPSGTRET